MTRPWEVYRGPRDFHRVQVALLRTTAAERSELLMAEVRVRLGQALMCEQRGEDELAESYGAVAGNRLSVALNLTKPKAARQSIHIVRGEQ